MKKLSRRQFLVGCVAFQVGNILGTTKIFGGAALGADRVDLFEAPRISLIIDDLGWSLRWANIFLSLDLPMTFSVLPRLPQSVKIAEMVHRAGRQVMLHQPMEPFGSRHDPGPGAVYVKDAPERIERIVSENIESMDFIEGVNNHMGSRFTSNAGRMDYALGPVREKGLFFVDSVTSGRSVGYDRARSLRMPAARRHVFIDNMSDERSIIEQLAKLYRRGLEQGCAIGIGHPRPATALAIEKFAKQKPNFGACMVPVSDLTTVSAG